jgi:hypothetical protein
VPPSPSPSPSPVETPDDDLGLGLGDNPLAGIDDPLAEHFYQAPARAGASRAKSRARGKGRQPLPDGKSWRLVTFSFYEDDVKRLDALLAEAKKKGHRKVSRSQIVRLALRNVDLSGLPDVV